LPFESYEKIKCCENGLIGLVYFYVCERDKLFSAEKILAFADYNYGENNELVVFIIRIAAETSQKILP
jgi:hypothetical protein